MKFPLFSFGGTPLFGSSEPGHANVVIEEETVGFCIALLPLKAMRNGSVCYLKHEGTGVGLTSRIAQL